MSRRILVVGASSTIGLEVIHQLKAEGVEVIGFVRNSSEEAQALGIELQTCDASFSKDQFPKIEGALDGIAFLPGTITLKPFLSLKEEEFVKDWEVNFLYAVKVLQQYLPNLKEASFSSVVLVSSVAAQLGMPFHASIASAKAALEALTRSLAAELAPAVRVNAVSPSLTETKLSQSLTDSEQKKANAAQRHPLKKIGNPTQIADSICYLLSTKSDFITGQILQADGGLSSLRVF